ncbi:hypothetical protein JXA80_02040, partial [bacterium]|nr:hypothetical protein [candidate division CSSED10-310 bacterium]
MKAVLLGKVGIWRFHRSITGFLAVVLLTGVYFESFSNYDSNIWDEGVPLSGALRMMNGDRPIRDFIAYPPGRYLLYRAAMHFGGVDVQSTRTATAVITAFAAALLWLIGTHLGLRSGAVVPVIIYCLMPMYYYYRFFSIMLILMILCIDLQIRSESIREAVTAGLLGGCIIWFRLVLGLFILAILPGIAVWVAMRRRKRRWEVIWIPTVLGWAGFVAQVGYVGGFNRWLTYVRICRSFTRAGLTDMALPWPPLWSMEYVAMQPLNFLFQDVLVYAGMVVILAGAFYAVRFYRKVPPTFLSLVVTAWIGMGLVIWRTGYGNLLRAAPPLILISVYLLSRASRWKRVIHGIGWLVFIGLALDSLVYDPITYQSIGIMPHCTARLTHPRYGVKLHPRDCALISEVTAAVEAAGRGYPAKLLVLPFHPLFYFITGLTSSSYFDWVLPGTFSDPKARAAMIRDVVISEPDIVLLNDAAFDGIPDRQFSTQYPELWMWITR